jgi:hypothetical protein
MMGDIENACLTAPITDKFRTVLGPEFGDDAEVRGCCIQESPGILHIPLEVEALTC